MPYVVSNTNCICNATRNMAQSGEPCQNYVLINDPKHMQKVYKWDRTDWYSAFNVKDTYVGVAATKSMEAHNWKRKRIGAAVSELPIIKPYINWPLVFHD